MENQDVRNRFADLLLNDRIRWGSRSLCHRLIKHINKDFRYIEGEQRPNADRYIENFYKSSSGKAMLKRIKELSIIASDVMLWVVDIRNTSDNRHLWWDNKDTFQALILDDTVMSPESRRAFASVMKTNDVFVHRDWVYQGELYGRDYEVQDNMKGYEGVGSEIRDKMFETMYRRFDSIMRQGVINHTIDYALHHAVY
jgi:hypothetical protein